MDPSQQKNYWDKQIVSWDASAYEKSASISFSERVVGLCRAHLRERRKYAAEAIVNHAPKSVLELGCGTGELLAYLPPCVQLDTYVGVDISPIAIKYAKSRDYPAVRSGRPEFIVSAIRELDLSDYGRFDMVIGLGLLPYLVDEEMEKLCHLIGDSTFLLDYHSKGLTIMNLLHWAYRKYACHPFYILHSAQEITAIFAQLGQAGSEIRQHGKLWFIQRLP